MGGDSATSNDEGDRSLRSPKVFERQGLLFGISGELEPIPLDDLAAPEDPRSVLQEGRVVAGRVP
jgi:hypothetical protein